MHSNYGIARHEYRTRYFTDSASILLDRVRPAHLQHSPVEIENLGLTKDQGATLRWRLGMYSRIVLAISL
jgi:hypothetical protein